EAVARVDGVAARLRGDRQQDVLPEVALGAGRGADGDRGVGEAHVQGVGVDVRVDGDGLEAELVAGADDAYGDLAAIRDEDTTEGSEVHRRSVTSAGAARSAPRPGGAPPAGTPETERGARSITVGPPRVVVGPPGPP